MKTSFDQEWLNWIKTNVDAGCSKNEIFKILVDSGYDYAAIKNQMNYEPNVPLDSIVNPHRQAQALGEAPGTDGAALEPSKLFLPTAQRVATDMLDIYTVEDFLTAAECEKIIERINRQKRPSTITGDEPDKYFRTSSTCDLANMDDPFIADIDARLCKYMGIDAAYSEPIQGQYYEVGQEFKPHTDYFEGQDMAPYGGQAGQRTYTFMLYLNEVEEGGETLFGYLYESFVPKAGLGLIWSNLYPDGRVNSNSLHHGTPVIRGHKAIITKWFRSYSNTATPMFTKLKEEYTVAYTPTGIDKRECPADIFKALREFYHAHQDAQVTEVGSEGYVKSVTGSTPSTMVELSPALRQKVSASLQPLMQQWSGEELEPTAVYGIRVYQRGCTLKPHRDRVATHVISAIINIDQAVTQEWPLVIEDHHYREHRICLKPGEMLFYESARLLHGRPQPLDGERFVNVFCHFRPVSYSPVV